MNKFFDYIQPTIVKTTDNEIFPKKLRNRYLLNFNVFGIDYFLEHYILTENENGTPYFVLNENSWGFELEHVEEEWEGSSLFLDDTQVLDIPRIYIDITDKFINDNSNTFISFVYQAIAQNSIWAVGIDNFLAGEDYYLNYTLYNFLANTRQIENPNFATRLPNYLDEFARLQTKYWADISNETYKDYKNVEYFNWMNNLLENEYTKNELDNFYSNFCKIILKYTKIDDSIKSEQSNQLYDLVLNYYAGFKSDAISTGINLVLGSLYGTKTTAGCGCNTTTTTNVSTETCYDLYSQAMPKYLSQMLSDYNFYNDWFTILITDSETNERIPNEALIKHLKQYINEFISLGYDLTFNTETNNNCECPTINTIDLSDCNYTIIKNFLDILKFVKKEEINYNKNKIKVFGTQFGNLLPYLQF